MAGNGDLTGQTAERTIAIADKYGFPPYRAGAGLLLVWGAARDWRRAPSWSRK